MQASGQQGDKTQGNVCVPMGLAEAVGTHGVAEDSWRYAEHASDLVSSYGLRG